MKISTSFLFDRATERMSTIQNKLATTQAQNILALSLLAATEPLDAVTLTRKYLFGTP